MECNVGKVDKVIRIILAIVIGFLGYYYSSSLGLLSWLFYVVALLLLITVIIGFCLPYKWFGINTCKPAKKKKK